MLNQVFEFALVKTPMSVFTFVLSLYKRLKVKGKQNEETRAFTILYENRWEPVLKAVFAVVIVVWIVWEFFWWIVLTSIIGGSLWLWLRTERSEESEMEKQTGKTMFFQIVEEEEIMLPMRGNKQAEIQKRSQQLTRQTPMVTSQLIERVTEIVTHAIGDGAGEVGINATQVRSVHPDGTRAKQDSLGINIVIDSKLKKR